MKCHKPTITITTMEHIPTETKEPVKEKHTPAVIMSERIALGYLGKDSYYHETKEEALVATSLKTKAQLLINDTIEQAKSNAVEARQAINQTVKQAMVNLALKKALQATEPTPISLQKYVTGSNTIPLKHNQYLEQNSHPAEPLNQNIGSNKALLERTLNAITMVKATTTKVLRYNRSAKSLL